MSTKRKPNRFVGSLILLAIFGIGAGMIVSPRTFKTDESTEVTRRKSKAVLEIYKAAEGAIGVRGVGVVLLLVGAGGLAYVWKDKIVVKDEGTVGLVREARVMLALVRAAVGAVN